MLSFECIKNEKSVYFLLTSAHFIQLATRGLDFGQPRPLRRVCCPTLHLVSSIDYSFIVSALALHRKGLYKNLQLVKASQANSIKTPSRQLSYTMVK